MGIEEEGAELCFGGGGGNQFEHGAKCVDWAIEPNWLIGADWFSEKVVAAGGAARVGLIEIGGVQVDLE